jgi:ATP-dependent Clp protease protease subunit
MSKTNTNMIRLFEGKPVGGDNLMFMKEHMAFNFRTVLIYGVVTPPWEARMNLIDDSVGCNAGDTISLLSTLASNSKEPIRMLINSPGGDVAAGCAIYDVMRMIPCPIQTVGITCYSLGAVLLAAGTPGSRYVLPHSRVMLHMLQTGFGGSFADVEIQRANVVRTQEMMIDMLLECGVKRTKDELKSDIERDKWMSAEEAIAYGMADELARADLFLRPDYKPAGLRVAGYNPRRES